MTWAKPKVRPPGLFVPEAAAQMLVLARTVRGLCPPLPTTAKTVPAPAANAVAVDHPRGGDGAGGLVRADVVVVVPGEREVDLLLDQRVGQVRG